MNNLVVSNYYDFFVMKVVKGQCPPLTTDTIVNTRLIFDTVSFV
jgi:hypothetical protein